MLLTPDHARQKLRRERLYIGLGLLGLSLLLLLVFWRADPKLTAATPERIACDAERTRGDYFYNGDFRFEGASYRSSAYAHSGRYSLALPADSATHYGFSIVLDAVRPGEVYEVTVWSYGNDNGHGKLAVQGRKPTGLYHETNESVQRDDQNWQLHRLRFHIPFDPQPSRLAIYVYSDGQEAVFFDDLMIKKVDLWDAQGFRPTKLELQLDEGALSKLEAKRQDALRRGILESSTDDWVNSRIRSDQSGLLEAKVRLKGDWLDHLRGHKWSFRVKLKDQFSWRGMRTFSLHTPAARYYLHEWLLHELWRKLGVLTTRYDFIELLVNGKSWGIYAYEEHFEKQLIESQARREGPILKYDESGFWAGMARQLAHHGFIRPGSGHRSQDFQSAPITSFSSDVELADNPVLAQQYAQAYRLLAGVHDGSVSLDRAFDLQLLAKYYAACDLLNAYHGIVWHNQRFYYNPVTDHLEPIGFDGFAEAPARRYFFLGEGSQRPDDPLAQSLFPRFMQHPDFVSHYLQTLETISRPQYWQRFMDNLSEQWTARAAWLAFEFSSYEFQPAELAKEVAFVRSHLLPIPEHSLQAYRSSEGVALYNRHTLPLELVGYAPSIHYPIQALDSTIWVAASPRQRIGQRFADTGWITDFSELNFLDQQSRAYEQPQGPTLLSLPATARYLYYRLPGWDSLLVNKVQAGFELDAIRIAPTTLAASPASAFPTFRWSADQKTVTIPAGDHVITQPLIIASQQRLLIAPDAQVDLRAGSFVLSYGPIQAGGQEEHPIHFLSTDGSGQGVHVVQTNGASQLRHVQFSQLGTLQQSGWQLTGAITFYEAAVQMADCVFRNNRSEDALNLIRSEVDITRCQFLDISSDGLDSDFCKGSIRQCRFVRTVNDGLDLSGSYVTVSACHFEDCRDKGISVGEASEVVLEDCTIQNCPIGIASKDLSTVLGRDLELRDCRQGVVVFQKKPEYGPAQMLLQNLNAIGVDRLYQIGPGSRLQIDDQVFHTDL
jgi:hypothetical protein